MSQQFVISQQPKAAVHIATSQVKGLLGLPMPTIFGTFGLARSWFYIFQHIRETQLAALLISLGNMAFIAGVDWFNNKYILSSSNAARVPLPVEAPPESRPTTPESDVENDQRPRSSSASPVSISMRVQSPMRLSPIHQLEVGVEAANIEIYDEDTSHPRPTVESDRRSIHTVHTSTPSTTGSNSSGRRLLPSPEKSTTMSSPISMLPTSYVEPTPPRPRKIPSFRCTIPIPAILLAVFLSTLIVYTAQLYVSKANGGAGVAIIGKVPAGFPSPLLPMTPAMLCPDIYNGTIATVPLSKEECSALISGVALTTARSSLTLAVVTM